MTYEKFCKTMDEFDRIVRRCSKCNTKPKCPMHKHCRCIKQIGKTAYLAKLKEIGFEGIQKELNTK